jgi:hypothetical protein
MTPGKAARSSPPRSSGPTCPIMQTGLEGPFNSRKFNDVPPVPPVPRRLSGQERADAQHVGRARPRLPEYLGALLLQCLDDQGLTHATDCTLRRHTGPSGNLVHLLPKTELLDGEIFYSLAEATTVIESWRRHYNTRRPHSSPGYRPPAPEVVSWPTSPSRAASPATPAVAPSPVMR